MIFRSGAEPGGPSLSDRIAALKASAASTRAPPPVLPSDDPFLLWRDREAVIRYLGTRALSPTATCRSAAPSAELIAELRDELVLQSFGRPPIATTNLLSRRRPPLRIRFDQLFSILEDKTEDILLFSDDDHIALVQMSSLAGKASFQLLTLFTSEAVIAGDRIAYWTRGATYVPSLADGLYPRMMRMAARGADLLDADEIGVLAQCGFHPTSRTGIERYLDHSGRCLPLFLLAAPEYKKLSSDFNRLQACLANLGALARGRPAWIERITGRTVKGGDLLIVPPTAAREPGLRTIPVGGIDSGDSGSVAPIIAEVGAALAAIPHRDPAWITDPGYAVPELGAAALDIFDLCPSSDGWRRLRVGRQDIAALDEALDEIGWDLHAPPRPPEPAAPEPRPVAEQDLRPAPIEDEPVEAGADAEQPLELDEQGFPVALADLDRWAAAALPPTILLSKRALRAARKADHPEPARVAAALQLLAGPRWRMSMGDRDATAEFEQGLMRLRLRDGFSNAERLLGRTGDEYILRLGKRRHLLDRHLASVSSGFNDPRMIRIYYFWCKDTRRIVVGHLPTHLTNTQS